MSLQDRLDAFKKDFESNKAPPEVVAAFHKATAELIASGQAERALKAGDRAPAFTLPDADGIAVSSTELLARGPLVLTFYRGVWCPYCNLDLQAIEAAADEIRGLGAALLAISPQTPANSRRSQRENKLSFPILSDHAGTVGTLPMPSRYIIGRDGAIAYAEVNPDYTRRPDPAELLPVLRRLKSARAA